MSHYSSPQEQYHPQYHNHHDDASTTVSSGNSHHHHHHNMTKLPSPSQLMNISYSPPQQQQQQQQNNNNLSSMAYLSPYETTTSHHNNNNNNSKKRCRSPDFDSSIYYQQQQQQQHQQQQQQYYEPQHVNQQHYNRYPLIASSSSNQQLQNHPHPHQQQQQQHHQSSFHHQHHHVAVDDNDDQYGAHLHSQKRARYHQQTRSPATVSASSTSSPRNDNFGSSPMTPHAHVIQYHVDWQQEKLACERYGPPPDYYAVVSSTNGSNHYGAARGGFVRFSDNPPSRPTASAVIVPEISTIASYSAPTAASSSVPHPHSQHHHVPISASSMNNSNMPHALTQQQANSATIVAPVGEHGVESTMIIANKKPIVPPVRDPLSIDSHLAHQPKKQFLPPSAVEVLKDWFYSHINYPYPTTDDRNHLSDVTGLSNLQITNWFTNERKRKWTPKMKKQQMQMKEAGVIATPWNPRTTRKKTSSPGDQNSASSSEGGAAKESASVDGQSTTVYDSRPQQEQLATNSEK